MFEDTNEGIFIDEANRPNCLITAVYKKSFAYTILKENIPKILKTVIDNLQNEQHSYLEKYGAECTVEVTEIINAINNLTKEILLNSEIVKLPGRNVLDEDLWNGFISSLITQNNTYFTTCFLYSECYIYRRLKSIFESSVVFKHYDYFRLQKEAGLVDSANMIEDILTIMQDTDYAQDPGSHFTKLLKLSLWGNLSDLLISNLNKENFANIDKFDEFILINNSSDIWKHLSTPVPEDGKRIIDFVTDNSGLEIFTDFLIAEFLIVHRYATKIRFYVKSMPWFVLDVTQSDFNRTLNYCERHPSDIIRSFTSKLIGFIDEGIIELQSDTIFWTSPYEFYRMKEFDRDLYKKLSEAEIIFFKGDLNYRKLIGDFKWHPTEKFSDCLRGFHPTNLCSLRAIKSEVICGLKTNQAEQLDKDDPMWMVTAKYGLITYFFKELKSEFEIN